MTDDDTITATLNTDDPDAAGLATLAAVPDDVTAEANDRGPDVTVRLPGVRVARRENVRINLSAHDAQMLAERLTAAAEAAE